MFSTIGIGTVEISVFHLFIGLGVLFALLFFEHTMKGKAPAHKIDNLVALITFSALFGVISAMLFDKLVHWSELSQQSGALFRYTGMTFLGGLLGGLCFFATAYRIAFHTFDGLLDTADCITPALILGHAIGRLGCFFGGCCYGIPSLFMGVRYPETAPAFMQYGNVPILALPLLEAIFLFILFICFCVFINTNYTALYMLSYGSFRFLNEFFRGDQRGTLFQNFLSPSQTLSFFLITCGVILLLKVTKKSPLSYYKGERL